jgi:AcrR family transcriptional regulator
MSSSRRSALAAVRPESPQAVETMTANQRARRQRVIDAVLALVDAGADEDMQMKEIADRSGVALGTIYRYFSSKDHLIAAALVEWARDLEEHVARNTPPDGSPADQLVAISSQALRAYQRRPMFARLLILVANSSDPWASECYREMGPVVFSTFEAATLDDEERDQVLTLFGALWYHELVEWVHGRRAIGDVQRSLERAAHYLLPG